MRPAVLSSGPSRPSCPYDVRGSDVQYEDARYPGPQTPHTSAWTSRCPLGLALALAAVAALLLASGWGSGTEGHAPGTWEAPSPLGDLACGSSSPRRRRIRCGSSRAPVGRRWLHSPSVITPITLAPPPTGGGSPRRPGSRTRCR